MICIDIFRATKEQNWVKFDDVQARLFILSSLFKVVSYQAQAKVKHQPSSTSNMFALS